MARILLVLFVATNAGCTLGDDLRAQDGATLLQDAENLYFALQLDGHVAPLLTSPSVRIE